MGIQRYGAEPGETYGEPEGWLVAYDDHLTALARQRLDIEKHVRGFSIDDDDTAYTISAKVRKRFESFGKEA